MKKIEGIFNRLWSYAFELTPRVNDICVAKSSLPEYNSLTSGQVRVLVTKVTSTRVYYYYIGIYHSKVYDLPINRFKLYFKVEDNSLFMDGYATA